MLQSTTNIAVRLWNDEKGASLLEYSVLVGLITAGVVSIIAGVALWTGNRWTALSNVLNTSGNGSGGG